MKTRAARISKVLASSASCAPTSCPLSIVFEALRDSFSGPVKMKRKQKLIVSLDAWLGVGGLISVETSEGG